MKRSNVILTLSLIFCLLINIHQGQAQATKYSRVQIDLRQHDINEVAKLGLEVDHGEHSKNKFLISDYASTEILKLKKANIPYTILINDVVKHYQSQEDFSSLSSFKGDCEQSDIISIVDQYETPENYTFGTMGGYYTYDEMITVLNDMHEKFPNLLSPMTEIGDFRTHDDRPIHYLRLSNNPDVDQENKPEVLFTALHHSREPNGLSQLIFFIWRVLENYGTDPQITWLVDNSEMYFIPCVNPDGYVYNEIIEPNGGGLWRKNRRDNGDGTFGVDLNRNYGYNWGYDDVGSSPDGASETHRGPSAESEPEVQAVEHLVKNHEFRITLNYHTYSNVLIHPWGYQSLPTEEDALFKGIAKSVTRENTYPYGTAFETIGYNANGVSDDWFYSDEDKPKIYAMTPEVGPQGFGFWPPESAIDELNKFCALQNITTVNILHYYLEPELDKNPVLESVVGTFDVDLTRYGLTDGSADITLTTTTSNLSITPVTYTSTLDLLASESLSFDYEYTPLNNGENEQINFTVNIDYGGHTLSYPVEKTFNSGEFEPLIESGLDDLSEWVDGTSWNVTSEDFVSAELSMTDSPFSRYSNGENSELIFGQSIDLKDAVDANIKYQAKWEIEEDFDYVQILAAGEDGIYEPLCGLFTNQGTGNQDDGQPLYDGEQNTWVPEVVSLKDFIGQQVNLKFRLISDNFVRGDGFYFDDLSINIIYGDPDNVSLTEGVDFKLFPNPFEESLQINQLGETIIKSAEVHNALGELVYKNQNLPSNLMIDTNDWDKGIYQVTLVSSTNDVITHSVVKI